MKRKQYFAHRNMNRCLYRFPKGNKTEGQFFAMDMELLCWRGGFVERITDSNWIPLSRDEARKQFPQAFRKA